MPKRKYCSPYSCFYTKKSVRNIPLVMKSLERRMDNMPLYSRDLLSNIMSYTLYDPHAHNLKDMVCAKNVSVVKYLVDTATEPIHPDIMYDAYKFIPNDAITIRRILDAYIDQQTPEYVEDLEIKDTRMLDLYGAIRESNVPLVQYFLEEYRLKLASPDVHTYSTSMQTYLEKKGFITKKDPTQILQKVLTSDEIDMNYVKQLVAQGADCNKAFNNADPFLIVMHASTDVLYDLFEQGVCVSERHVVESVLGLLRNVGTDNRWRIDDSTKIFECLARHQKVKTTETITTLLDSSEFKKGPKKTQIYVMSTLLHYKYPITIDILSELARRRYSADIMKVFIKYIPEPTTPEERDRYVSVLNSLMTTKIRQTILMPYQQRMVEKTTFYATQREYEQAKRIAEEEEFRQKVKMLGEKRRKQREAWNAKN